jgi:hypothetical protein
MTLHLSVLRGAILAITLANSSPLFADTKAGTSTTATSVTPAARPAPDKKLNLKVPDVNRTMTPAERKVAISGEPSDGSETVEVESQRAPGDTVAAPKPPGGLASVFWAFAHPIQAWRVFFPEPPAQQPINTPPRNN